MSKTKTNTNKLEELLEFANNLPSIVAPESILPSGYTRLEYIESTGAQYINTGYIHTANTKITLDCNVTNTTRDTYIAIFGSMNSNKDRNAFSVFTRFGGSNAITIARTGNETRGNGMIYNKRVFISAYKTLVTVTDGVDTYVALSTGTVNEGGVAMGLFSNLEGTNFNRHSVMKLYRAQFLEKDVVVADFIPCKNSSGVAGLYDIKRNTFYRSNSNTAFVAGPTFNAVSTASEADIRLGQIASINGRVTIGTMPVDAYEWGSGIYDGTVV